ncbi:DedA family protein [Ruthenibacterium lactatiformans]|uniref:DedA family protein n=1 Tax=Ruthenibacterium lactatiformans TaxID=1550024 RepID=UPI0039A2949E
MESVITGLVSRFGYWGVLLLIAVENIFPPIPSEVILTFGGFLTTCTEMTPPGIILFSTLGSVAGAIVLYGVGRLLAPQRLEALLSGRVGRVLKMESADVHKASDWFAAHGWPSVFFCRCIPILRSLISIRHGGHASGAVFAAHHRGQPAVEYPAGLSGRAGRAKLACRYGRAGTGPAG